MEDDACTPSTESPATSRTIQPFGRAPETAELVLRACPDYIVDATTFRDTYLRTVETSPAIAALYGRLADLPDGRDPSVRVVLLKRKPLSRSNCR